MPHGRVICPGAVTIQPQAAHMPAYCLPRYRGWSVTLGAAASFIYLFWLWLFVFVCVCFFRLVPGTPELGTASNAHTRKHTQQAAQPGVMGLEVKDPWSGFAAAPPGNAL